MKPVRNKVRDQVYFQVHDQVIILDYQSQDQVWDKVEKQVRSQVWHQVGRNVVNKARSKQ